MQVTVESTQGLERRMQVTIPEERIKGEVERRLDDMMRKVRLPGFRPGKAPRKVVAQRFGRQVRDEVVGEMVQRSFYDALSQEKLQPAGNPTIEPLEVGPDGGFGYTAVFDIFPEIALPDLGSIEIARPAAEVADADVDRMIETLRRQRRTFEAVERAATESDRVVIDFQGYVDGEPLERGQGTDFAVELDGGRMIPGFEAGLVGATAGQQLTLELTFPENYGAGGLAGKPARFEVTVKAVEEPRLPEVDDAFAEGFGIADKGVAGLREEVRGNMQRELTMGIRNLVKQRVTEALLDATTVDVPPSLVTSEADEAIARRRSEMANAGIDPEQIPIDREMVEGQARRRVALGLLLGEIIKVNEIKVDPNRVRERVEMIATTYEQPEQVVAWYYSDRQRLGEIESVVLEDQVIDWVVERMKVTEQPSSFDAIMNPGQTTGQP
ncbi:MAG: trigger factor [Ectothiorhodospiraceae bacterium]|nr:trigger factor [Chromatiales bacterium]MCP5157405.1 trigger factor [Ectothiorhodospiraceae bacterium]